jgi:predicted Zn-dependent protease
LAQAYIGAHRQQDAMEALKSAAAITPNDEKLYVFVSDACLDQGYYDLGMRVVDLGLQNLRESARLLYQRGILRLRVEQIDLADRDFERAHKISPDSDIGYIAAAQEALSSGDIPGAIRVAREGIRKGHRHYMLLTMLGEALLRSGVTPASPAEFAEAQSVLEGAVAERPDYSSGQISLGKLYLLENRPQDAIAHLELGRQLDPHDPAVYANLAAAYRSGGDRENERKMLAMLAALNRQDAARIASAPGGHSGIAATPPTSQHP